MPGAVPVTAPWWSAYVGLPYEDGGCGPKAVDCWGAVCLIYRERLGIELPIYGEISAQDLLRIARAIASGSGIEDGWAPVDDPQPYDVVMMRSGRGSRATVHVGIMVTERLMLHAEAGMGSGVVPVNHYSVAGRILGCRRHAACRLSWAFLVPAGGAAPAGGRDPGRDARADARPARGFRSAGGDLHRRPPGAPRSVGHGAAQRRGDRDHVPCGADGRRRRQEKSARYHRGNRADGGHRQYRCRQAARGTDRRRCCRAGHGGLSRAGRRRLAGRVAGALVAGQAADVDGRQRRPAATGSRRGLGLGQRAGAQRRDPAGDRHPQGLSADGDGAADLFPGPDEIVEAAYVLAGPHQLEDIRIGPAPVASMADVEVETREGWLGEAPVYLLSRQGRTEAINSELRAHVVGDDNRTIESPAGDILTALPQPQVFATREAPDEHQLQISFPQGLQLATGESGVAIRVPLRIRTRRVGDVGWRNLPELHFQQRQLGQIRATIRFAWTDDPSGAPAAASGSGWVEARRFAPGQTALPAAEDWAADQYFGTSGPDYLDAGNAGTTGVQHVQMDRWTATLLLDRTEWPPGCYEFEILRGAAFKVADYAASSYQYGGSVWDFFGRRGTPGQIVMSRDNVVDSLYLLRSVSIWDEHPLPSRDLAVIAIRARNRAADRLSVLASGWVRDWDGTGWRDWVTTSNPAPHLVDVWTGMLNVDPVPDGLIWHDRLLEWRAHCAAEGYTVDAIIEDRSVDDVARLVASCGYAEPYMSDQWGVVYDRDTSAEAPVQVFTGRNSQGFGWSKGFARMPDGLRVNFAEQVRDYEPRQISVFRPGLSNDNGRVEQVDYPGLVDYDAVHRRALYDQAQAIHRSTFYNLTAPAEYLLSRRGDLVGIQHQALSEWAGSARVAAVQLDGNGDTVAILPDTPLTISQRPYMDQVPNLAAEDRLDLLGLRMGLAIRAGGDVGVYAGANDGDWIDLDPPAPGDITGALVVVGASGRVYRRVRIMDIEPGDDLTARITAVDEAPQIWSMLHG